MKDTALTIKTYGEPVEVRKQAEAELITEVDYLNKPNLLHDIRGALAKGKFTSTPTQDGSNTTKIKLGNGGLVFLRYEGDNQKALSEIVKAVDFAINDLYPSFDKNAGGLIDGAKELAEKEGLGKRKTNFGKELNSFDPRTLKRLDAKVLEATKVWLEFQNIPLTVSTTSYNRSGKPIKKVKTVLLKGSGSLISTVQTDDKIMWIPHPTILVYSYGKTVDMARQLTGNSGIEAIRQQHFFISLAPTTKERQLTAGSTIIQNHENILDRFVNKLKQGQTTLCIPIDKEFRPFYPTKNDWEFRRDFKKNQAKIIAKNGGDWEFTNQLNKQGEKLGKDKFGKGLFMNYKNYQPFQRKKAIASGLHPKVVKRQK